MAEDAMIASIRSYTLSQPTNAFPIISIGYDGLTGGGVTNGAEVFTSSAAVISVAAGASTSIVPQIGYHRLLAVENTADATGVSFQEVNLTALLRA
jgi:hypothetical protein